jgi:hypothetical protein
MPWYLEGFIVTSEGNVSYATQPKWQASAQMEAIQ